RILAGCGRESGDLRRKRHAARRRTVRQREGVDDLPGDVLDGAAGVATAHLEAGIRQRRSGLLYAGGPRVGFLHRRPTAHADAVAQSVHLAALVEPFVTGEDSL